jgi:hypothetical protein
MSVKLHRCLLAGLTTAALMPLLAGSAQAASVATTLPARYVTAQTALLRGTVSTGGQRTIWAFQYGRSTHYNQVTATRTIPAGHGQVNISLKIAGLRRHTRYHFRLLTQYGQGSIIYPIFVNFGSDRSFVTRANGNFGLGSPDLIFSDSYAPVPLYCAGSKPCAGKLTLSRGKPGHPKTLVTLGQREVTVKGGQYRTVPVRLTNAALALLKQNGGQIGATLTLRPNIGHATLRRAVALIH